MMTCAGWDIGGAHVKIAFVNQGKLIVEQVECPLWKGVGELISVLKQLMDRLPRHIVMHHVTMTGELADVFKNRQDGVTKIVTTFSNHLPCEHDVKYFSRDGLLNSEDAIYNYQAVASANWIASGECLAKFCDSAIFVDIGSTTTDVLKITNGSLVISNYSDFERLRSGELVYTGVVRSCVNTIAREVMFKGDAIPLIAELFASSADIYRILGKLPDHADLGNTMDGMPKDRLSSFRRLARMLGCDYQDSDANEWISVANQIAQHQMDCIKSSIKKMIDEDSSGVKIVGAGIGRFLLEDIATQLSLPYVDIVSVINAGEITPVEIAADCAPAISLVIE